jgi:hypothetical protein
MTFINQSESKKIIKRSGYIKMIEIQSKQTYEFLKSVSGHDICPNRGLVLMYQSLPNAISVFSYIENKPLFT